MQYNHEYWKDVELALSSIPRFEKLFGKTVFIAGSTGLIGSSIVEIIAYSQKILGSNIHLILAGRSKEKIADRFRNIDDFCFQFQQYDARSEQPINCAVDYIIHGAGVCSPNYYKTNPVETIKTNVFGVQSLLELAKNNMGSRLLYISSSEIYGIRTTDSLQPFREDEFGYVDILNPRSCYPMGKRAAETLCASYAAEYGVDSVMVRPGHIYGPFIAPTDQKASSQFFRSAIEKKDIVLKSAGLQKRSYCFMLDCASAILTVLLNGSCGDAYNISNPASLCTIRQFAEKIAEIARVRIIFENPSDIERQSFNAMDNSTLDSTKLRQLGWRGVFCLDEGVRRTYETMMALNR